jgi:hypothetical protein
MFLKLGIDIPYTVWYNNAKMKKKNRRKRLFFFVRRLVLARHESYFVCALALRKICAFNEYLGEHLFFPKRTKVFLKNFKKVLDIRSQCVIIVLTKEIKENNKWRH